RVELASPVTAKLQLRLNLVPRVVLTPKTLSLRLPVPVNGKQAEGFLAYRLASQEASDKTQNLGVTSIAPEAFAKVWKAAGQGKVIPTRAYSFRRTAGNAGLLVALPAVKPRATPALVWHVDTHHADLTATVPVSAND